MFLIGREMMTVVNVPLVGQDLIALLPLHWPRYQHAQPSLEDIIPTLTALTLTFLVSANSG